MPSGHDSRAPSLCALPSDHDSEAPSLCVMPSDHNLRAPSPSPSARQDLQTGIYSIQN